MTTPTDPATLPAPASPGPGMPDVVDQVALARLYHQAAQWSDLIDVLRRQAEWADPRERKEILFRVGLIQQDLLRDSAAAIAMCGIV